LGRDVLLNAAGARRNGSESRTWGRADRDSDSGGTTALFARLLGADCFSDRGLGNVRSSLCLGCDGRFASLFAVYACGVVLEEFFATFGWLNVHRNCLLSWYRGSGSGGAVIRGVRWLERFVAGSAILIIVVNVV